MDVAGRDGNLAADRTRRHFAPPEAAPSDYADERYPPAKRDGSCGSMQIVETIRERERREICICLNMSVDEQLNILQLLIKFLLF